MTKLELKSLEEEEKEKENANKRKFGVVRLRRTIQ